MTHSQFGLENGFELLNVRCKLAHAFREFLVSHGIARHAETEFRL